MTAKNLLLIILLVSSIRMTGDNLGMAKKKNNGVKASPTPSNENDPFKNIDTSQKFNIDFTNINTQNKIVI